MIVSLKFVIREGLSDESETPPEMQMAFDTCKSTCGMTPSWVSETDCCAIDVNTLTKQDVFVLESFEGSGFNYLHNSKALLLGTRCLLSCITQDQNIPLGSSPVFTTAMRGMIIAISGLDKDEKAETKKYIEWMGGICNNELSTQNTHLISNTVNSVKYSKACTLMPVMNVHWVPAMWEATLKDASLGNCDEFTKESLSKFRLKPFHGLNITSTMLRRQEKSKIQNLINLNGGTYMGNFSGATTDYLVLHKADATNEKYNGAVLARKVCVTPLWVEDSVRAGYALPVEGPYKVNKNKCSTPTRQDMSLDPDFSTVSVISHINGSKVNINETMDKSNTTMLRKKSESNPLADLNISEIRKAGSFLDGCGIFLSGFTPDDRETLNKVLNYGSATRYDTVSDRVTHILINKNIPSDIQAFKNKQLLPYIVNIKWLIDSINLKQPAPEENYVAAAQENMEPASPMSKKNLQMMRPKLPPVPKFNLDNDEPDNNHDILEQYKKPLSNASRLENEQRENEDGSYTHNEESDDPSEYTEYTDFLSDKTFYVCDQEEDEADEIVEYIEKYGGTVVDSKQAADYIIVPLIWTVTSVPETASIVTKLWLIDCVSEQCLTDIQYYHEPIVEHDEKPLDGVVFAISTYTGNERQYLTKLGEANGAIFNQAFVRKTSVEKKLRASTHLICPTPVGDKYMASIKWGVPALTAQWLIECGRTRTFVTEIPYLIGDSKAPIRSPINSSADEAEKNSSGNRTLCDKEIDNSLALKRKRTIFNDDDAEENKKAHFTPKMPKANLDISAKSIDLRNKHLQNAFNISDTSSQKTPPPVSKILKSLRNEGAGTPDSPGLPPTPGKMKTPDTPYGRFIFPDPSPETRKRWKRYCDNIPTYMYQPVPEPKPSTPWHVVKNRVWRAICPGFSTPESEKYESEEKSQKKENEARNSDDGTTNPMESSKSNPIQKENAQKGVNTQLQHLNEMLTVGMPSNSGGANNAKKSLTSKYSLDNMDKIASEFLSKQSQAESVGWRDPSEIAANVNTKPLKEIKPFRQRPPKFMLTGIENREEIINLIIKLGASVSQQPDYDSTCSHVLCDKPQRSEKLFAAMASGKWVLSSAYISKCIELNTFLDEEPYEWGNPIANFGTVSLSPMELTQANANYRWRSKLNNGQDDGEKKGAFTGFKVILNVDRKAQFQRLITAGNGQVINVEPPFTSVTPGMVTHCFCEPRKRPFSTDEIRHLTRCGAFCLPIQYISGYLTDDPPLDPREQQITV